ncbi:MAG: DUF58 domain-containing protein [Lachnospiraceae bacterium]|nr:DUF58 domain-containing protein [Lachnospiraceae bacterium]
MKRRLLIYLSCLILALVGISFHGGPVTHLFLRLVLLLPLFSILYIGYVIIFLKIYQKTDGRNMVSGSPTDFYITLQNEGPFSFSALRIQYYSSFSTIMDLPEDVIYELPAGTRIQKKTQLLCRYRGEYQVGIKKITVWDPFGFLSFTYRIREPLSVIVAPALIPLAHPDDNELLLADHDSLVNRTEPDINVREYQRGDVLRMIHWKSSAVMQKLMVRERIGEEMRGVGIFMECHRNSDRMEDYLPMENRIVERVLSLAEYYMRQHIPADVLLQKERVVCKPVLDTSGFEDLYNELFHYSFREYCSVQQMLQKAEPTDLSRYRMLIFIVHRWGTEEETLLKEINTSHIPVSIQLQEVSS